MMMHVVVISTYFREPYMYATVRRAEGAGCCRDGHHPPGEYQFLPALH
jgi:hypothetical protein